MLKLNDEIEEFTVTLEDNKKYQSQDLHGKKGSIFYFYPKNNTPGCTIQAIDFSHYAEKINIKGFNIYGVSKDSVESHCAFISKKDLKIHLISDETKTIHHLFSTWGLKKFMGKEYFGTIRSTFILNCENKIIFAQYNVKAKGHIDKVLQFLKQY